MKKAMVQTVIFIFMFLCSQSLFANPQLIIDFESQPFGTTYGHQTHSHGDVIFLENGFPVKIDSFYWTNGGTAFNQCQINNIPAGFGSGNSMWTNNINLRFDFLEEELPVQYLTFQYADCGGNENLIINGDLFTGELDALDNTMLGGVAVYVKFFASDCGKEGMVTLVGSVEQLLVGGQEFAIDNIHVYYPSIPHNRCVHFESQIMGTPYGAGINSIGDIIFVENGIPVSVEYFNWSGGGGMFGFCEIMDAAPFTGFGNIMWTNNINLGFNLSGLGFYPQYIHFQFADLGGEENLIINGDIRTGELTALDGMVVGGVLVEVNITSTSGGIKGEVELHGPVDFFQVGGQEFCIDNVCVWAEDPFGDCVRLIDHEALTYLDFYGTNNGNNPGDIIFTEDGIPVSIWEFNYTGGGTGFSIASVDSASNGFGSGQTMMLSNINANYDFAATGYLPQQVVFEFIDYGGYENISVNGHTMHIGELTAAPVAIAPTVNMAIALLPSAAGQRGLVFLNGPVHNLTIGGQEFWIDNICASNEIPVIVEELQIGPKQFELYQNYPNPFNPQTEIKYYLPVQRKVELVIFNALGQKVKTLKNILQAAGNYSVTWDGKDMFNKEVPSGIYFYRLWVSTPSGKAGNFIQTKKMALIR